jgi:hypothetical protein
MSLFTVLAPTGEKFSISLCLAHNCSLIYRKDEKKARKYRATFLLASGLP